ncbi:MAG: urate oxidase [Acidobacteria bacterium]|nr:urate oxidase [Acidobacteriota bacterium]MCA1609944.1 urate oxidase [Acidobacteriota bacterium]
MLAENSYGKSGIRLVHRRRRSDRHEIRDLTVAVALEGDFEAAHVEGDNSVILPTDTMKNTVYALARTRGIGAIETFALALADHFLGASAAASAARVSITERPWSRLPSGSGEHPSAFALSGAERRVVRVERTRSGVSVRAGLEDLTLLKSGSSGFSGFLRDAYTTLRETDDRIMATAVRALWSYAPGEISWEPVSRAIRSTLLETFADHVSASVQHTLHAMGEAVLDAHSEVTKIRLSMPNKHHLLVDLSPFGLDNPGEVFVATEEPYGLIEATMKRGR